MQGITATTPSVSENGSDVLDAAAPEIDDTFDPIREIRRLRQDLSHRLQNLQQEKATEPDVSPDRPEPDAVDSACDEEQTHRDPHDLLERIQSTRTMLSRIRHDASLNRREEPVEKIKDEIKEEVLATVPEPVSTNIESDNLKKAPSYPASNDLFDDSRAVVPDRLVLWVSTLKTLNAGFVLLGWIGLFLGVLYHLRGNAGDIRFGLPVAIIGLTLIFIGVLGRLVQDSVNRRADGGKLTTHA